MAAEHPASPPEAAFAGTLKALRAARLMTQAQLAKEMSLRGFKWHPATVYKVENGERQIQLAEALEIARIFGTAIEDMASDRQGTELVNIREDYRRLRLSRESLKEEVSDYIGDVIAFRHKLAEDKLRKLLPPDELQKMLQDADADRKRELIRQLDKVLGLLTAGTDDAEA